MAVHCCQYKRQEGTTTYYAFQCTGGDCPTTMKVNDKQFVLDKQKTADACWKCWEKGLLREHDEGVEDVPLERLEVSEEILADAGLRGR